MSRTKTRETLAAGNYMHIINILMQLRKVCNHPNLFAEPEVASPLVMEPLVTAIPSLVYTAFERDEAFALVDQERRGPFGLDLCFLNLCLLHNEVNSSMTFPTAVDTKLMDQLPLPVGYEHSLFKLTPSTSQSYPQLLVLHEQHLQQQRAKLAHHAYVHKHRSQPTVVYGGRLRAAVWVVSEQNGFVNGHAWDTVQGLFTCVASLAETLDQKQFVIMAQPALAPPPVLVVPSPCPWYVRQRMQTPFAPLVSQKELLPPALPAVVDNNLLSFPDRRLIQVCALLGSCAFCLAQPS